MMRLALILGGAALLLGSATAPPSVPPPMPAPLLAYHLPEPTTEILPIAALEVPPPQPEPQAEPVKVAAQTPAAEDEAAIGRPDPRGVRIVVSIPLQKAYVFDDGELLWTSPVSTGKKGHKTPTGRFPILQKKVHHRSSKYDNAPMPYMQRLTWYGIALHAGHVPGYPASHGCIRLPRAKAKKLYDLTNHGTLVTITKAKPKTAEAALSLA